MLSRPRRPQDAPVNAITRKGRTFLPRPIVVGAPGGQPAGPNRVAAANPDRISLWIKAPAANTALVLIGDSGVEAIASAPGNPPTFGRSWELEPGESIIIDDTTAEVWATALQGFAGQVLKVIEQVDR
jgi:hypothetical protein